MSYHHPVLHPVQLEALKEFIRTEIEFAFSVEDGGRYGRRELRKRMRTAENNLNKFFSVVPMVQFYDAKEDPQLALDSDGPQTSEDIDDEEEDEPLDDEDEEEEEEETSQSFTARFRRGRPASVETTAEDLSDDDDEGTTEVSRL